MGGHAAGWRRGGGGWQCADGARGCRGIRRPCWRCRPKTCGYGAGGKRARWNRGHDLATGAPLNRVARDGETRRRLMAGESGRVVAQALRGGLPTVQGARWAV